jgi:hypothetical protein
MATHRIVIVAGAIVAALALIFLAPGAFEKADQVTVPPIELRPDRPGGTATPAPPGTQDGGDR